MHFAPSKKSILLLTIALSLFSCANRVQNFQTEDCPIVQVIDNLERNNKLGLIFEFSVGDGKLLECIARLDVLAESEAYHLYKSMINYTPPLYLNVAMTWNDL